ncbi:hypothetical protein BY996DRAFT_6408705 [Phakopsora pachyrhizi]|nr:hypothetical protein BY996DRAFT_6408705 [Phakopsora pachyrhizi]
MLAPHSKSRFFLMTAISLASAVYFAFAAEKKGLGLEPNLAEQKKSDKGGSEVPSDPDEIDKYFAKKYHKLDKCATDCLENAPIPDACFAASFYLFLLLSKI